MEKNINLQVKIFFLGMLSSGKTQIINRIVNNSFSAIYNSTVDMT